MASQHSTPTGGSRDVSDPDGLDDRSLVVVSNREPYQHRHTEDGIVVDEPVGGLTAALDRVMQRTDGTWIAWGDADADPAVVNSANCVRVPPDDPGYTLRRVWLGEDAVREYYYGFSNQVLWPLCHDLVGKARFEHSFWERYRRVNERFAEVVADRADEDAIVWFQDYHLGLAPRMVRPALPEGTTVMQFWHIPWPAPDTFRVCPQRCELLEGLLGNDLLAFHIPRYRENFFNCVSSCLDDAEVDRTEGTVSYRGHTTQVEAFPMSVDAERIGRLSARTDEEFWPAFADRHGIDRDATVAVGVDRLDYTKGIPERLAALECLWERHPEWRGELTYVQKATESRSEIPAYQELQSEVRGAIERINDRFGTDDWTPVVLVDEYLSDERLYGLYRRADVALVTPIRDGMNLVSKEYVAAQTAAPGVLVLSELAGAEESLGDHAVTVEPYDAESFSESIAAALAMPHGERTDRVRRLQSIVRTDDLEAWMRNLFGAVGALDREEGAEPAADAGEVESEPAADAEPKDVTADAESYFVDRVVGPRPEPDPDSDPERKLETERPPQSE